MPKSAQMSSSMKLLSCSAVLNVLGLLLICLTTSHGVTFSNVTYINGTDCMTFFVSKVYLVNMNTNEKITLPDLSTAKQKYCDKTTSFLSLAYGAVGEIKSLTLDFKFTKGSRYWESSSTNISITCQAGSKTCVNVPSGYLTLDWLSSPVNMSYKCAHPSIAKVLTDTDSASTVGIQFYWLQVQPFDVSGGRFHTAVDCTGIFTIPIWSTLSVSFLLIGILSYGLVMLSAVKPNMLFDDPKAKMVQLGGNN